LLEPPNAINAKGLEFPCSSFKQLDNPFFANEVLPIPGHHSKPKQ